MWVKRTLCPRVPQTAGNLAKSTSEGQGVEREYKKSHVCALCRSQGREHFVPCSQCQCVKYYSSECQSLHQKEHKVLCNAITYLTEKENKEMKENGFYRTHLTPKQHTKVVNIVGKKCIINCLLNGIRSTALWDTGAQVSIVPKEWVNSHMTAIKVCSIHELLDGQCLNLTAANCTSFQFEGWVEIDFELVTGAGGNVKVPFLVSRDCIDNPIVGYNVISEIVKQKDKAAYDIAATITHLKKGDIDSLVQVICTNDPSCELATIKTSKRDIIIPSKQSRFVNCVAKVEPTDGKIPILFEPSVDTSCPDELDIHESLLTIS